MVHCYDIHMKIIIVISFIDIVLVIIITFVSLSICTPTA